MTRFFALALLCAGLMTAAVRAQDAPSPEALRAALELTGMVNADTIKQMSVAMTTQIWPSIESRLASKVDAATLAEMRGVFESSVASFAGETTQYAAPIYARHFSAQELDQIVAFYRTPTGAKALHEMPKVMGDVMAQMGPRVQAFQQDLNGKIVAILHKHGYKD